MSAPDLDLTPLDLGLRTVGRKPKLRADFAGEITPADLDRVEDAPEGGTKPPAIKKIRQRHHSLAKLLADEVPEGDAAVMVGMSASRVSVLKTDPSFRDLVTFYKREKREAYLELHEKIAQLGEDAVDELTARVEENPEDISVGQLIEISKMTLDRSGHGPQTSTNVNVNVGMGDRMAAARERALAARQQSMIDITPPDESPDV